MSETHETQDRKGKSVSWVIFTWTIALFIVVVGWMFTQIDRLNNKVEASVLTSQEIKVQLSQIQTDLQWVKLNLSAK